MTNNKKGFLFYYSQDTKEMAFVLTFSNLDYIYMSCRSKRVRQK